MDWEEIKEEYVRGDCSVRALARRWNVAESTLRGRARREGWEARRADALRPEAAEKAERGALCADEAEPIFRVTDKLVQRAEALLDASEEMGARELGELMRAMKSAKEIRMLRSALDEREQAARVRALEEKNSTDAPEALEIRFSPRAEEAAK